MKRFAMFVLTGVGSITTFAQQRTVFAGRILNPKGPAVKLEALDGIGQPHEAKLIRPDGLKLWYLHLLPKCIRYSMVMSKRNHT